MINNQEDLKKIIARINRWEEEVTNKQLANVVDWLSYGCMVGYPKPQEGDTIFDTIIGEDILDQFIRFHRDGKPSDHLGLVNMVRMHLLQLMFNRFKKMI